jgi:hypothetical protein
MTKISVIRGEQQILFVPEIFHTFGINFAFER